MQNSRKLRFTPLNLYMSVICIFPITTMLVDGTIVNKVIFAVMFALHFYSFFASRMKKRTVLSLVWLVVHYVYAVIVTDFPMSNGNMLFYFPYYMMYMYFVCDNKDKIVQWFRESKQYLEVTVLAWSIMVGVSVFVPGCYYIKEGGSYYFGSWVQDIFRLGPSAVFIQILAIVLQTVHGKKHTILYMIIPMYCGLMGSSRSYFVVISLLAVISWYLECKSKKVFWGSVIPLGIMILGLISVTSMGDKIAFTLDESNFGDFWFRVTSSRSVLWAKDMLAWMEMSFIQKLLGCGLNFTYEASGRWAHNDFIEILCSFGIVGVIQYILAMLSMLKNSRKDIRLPWVINASAIMIWLFNAFFNMHYVYFCAMLSYPFLLLALRSTTGKLPGQDFQYSNQDSKRKTINLLS